MHSEDRYLYECAIGVVLTTSKSQAEKWATCVPKAFVHTDGFAKIVELVIARQKHYIGVMKKDSPDSTANIFIILDGVTRQEANIPLKLRELRILVTERSPESFGAARLMCKSAWELSDYACVTSPAPI